MRRSSAERASVVLGVDEGEDEVLHVGMDTITLWLATLVGWRGAFHRSGRRSRTCPNCWWFATQAPAVGWIA